MNFGTLKLNANVQVTKYFEILLITFGFKMPSSLNILSRLNWLASVTKSHSPKLNPHSPTLQIFLIYTRQIGECKNFTLAK